MKRLASLLLAVLALAACDGYECSLAGGPACDPDPHPSCDTVDDCKAHTELPLDACMKWSCDKAHECVQMPDVGSHCVTADARMCDGTCGVESTGDTVCHAKISFPVCGIGM